MTTSTFATRADRLPEGLCWIAAHGDIPGGLAWRHEDGCVTSCDGEWIVTHEDASAASFEGVPLTWVPTNVAEESPDPRVVAYANDQKLASNTEFSA